MLRWCQSTLRTLDGHGRNTSNIRRLSSGIATIASSTTHSFRRLATKGQNTSFLEDVSDQAARTRLEQRVLRPTSGRLARQAPRNAGSVTLIPASLNDKVDFTTSALTSDVLDSVPHVLADLPDSPMSPTAHATENTHGTISTIEKLLSPNASEKKSSIRTLASLYDDASKRSAVHLLGSEGLTSILGICGSLASNPLRTIYDNPIAARFQSDLPKTQLWSFIAKVGADKADSGFQLTLEDRYWVIQAHLAKVRVTTNTNLQPDLDILRLQYEQLQNMSDAPDVHLPYLNFLVSTRNIPETVRCLCRVLQRVAHPDLRFAQFLWDIILLHGSDLSIVSKELICATVSHRVNTVPSNRGQCSFGVLPITSLTSDVVSQGIIGMPRMSAAFANALFPCYDSHHPGGFLYRWAVQQARQAFAPRLPIEIRWSNIILLAAAIHPKNLAVFYQSTTTASPDSESILWRTALALENMNRTLASTGSDYGSLCGKAQAVARPLWKTFMGVEKGEQHVDINRAYISAFLQVAGKSYDERLKGECYRLSKELKLWSYNQNDHWTTKAQAINIIAAYAKAHISCEGRDWVGCFSAISALLPGLAWQEDVTTLLIQQYSQQKVETAYDLYVHCLEVGVPTRPETVNSLFTGLVKHQHWDIITLFLKHSSTTHHQLQFLFGESLRVFQAERYRYVDPTYIKLLAHTAFKLYEHQSPPPSLKYPIRYFLSIIIWSRHVQDMIKLVELLHPRVPTFFTPSLLRTLTLQLVRHCKSSEALKLFRIFEHGESKSSSRSLERIRRGLMFKFFKKGAHSVARRVIRGEPQIISLTKREALARRGIAVYPPPASFYQHVQNVAFRASSDGPTVREATSLLVKANRSFTARKLYARCRSTLNVKTRTAIGNIIIHGTFQGTGFRNARLVRRVVRMKDLLVNRYGFVPDRTTLNIILKAILNWRTMLDAPKVRRLFDNMAHAGYPIPEQFRRDYGVPFGSRKGSFNSLPLASLPLGYSFSKHVRPMYKMFIKAFYVRKDVSAAKTVVGILKEVEIVTLRELEKRDKARREGVIRKKLKLRKKIEEVGKDTKSNQRFI